MRKRCVIVLLVLFVFQLNQIIAQEIDVLFVMSQNYGPNNFFTRDDMQEYGWNMTLAGVTERIDPCPYFEGLSPIYVDTLLSEIDDITKFDVLAFMQANWRVDDVYSDIMGDTHAMDLVVQAYNAGLVIYAPCAAVRVLAAADIIDGIHVVGTPYFQPEYEAAGAIYMGSDSPPIIEGNIITCVRGQYYHLQNCQAIATVLERKQQTTSNNPEIQGFESHTVPINDVNVLWAKTYGGALSEGGRFVCETAEGGFMIVGYTYSHGNGDPDIFVLNTDSDGNELWSKTYGGSSWEYGYSICRTNDNAYVFTGYTTSFGAGSKDVYLVKIDHNGDVLWTKTIGDSGIDVGRSFFEMSEGNLIVCGYTESSGSGEDDLLLVKTNSEGNVLWRKTFGGVRSDLGKFAYEDENYNIIIVGANGSDGVNMDYYFLKTDSDGNLQQSGNYGSHVDFPFDMGNSICPADDNGYIMIGDSNIETALNMMLIKIDSLGNEIWIKSFGDGLHDHGNSIVNSNDGYAICGSVRNTETLHNDLHFAQLDWDGNEIWQNKIGGSESDWGSYVIKTSDGCYVIVGHSYSFGAGKSDVFLIKISSLFPQFEADPIAGKIPLQVNFTDLSMGSINFWQWDFENDGEFETQDQNPSWTFNEPGAFDVCLEISDGNHANQIIRNNYIHAIGDEAALCFDGTDSYVSCGATASLCLTNQFTLEAWIYPYGWGESAGVGLGKIIDKTDISLQLIGDHLIYNDQCLYLRVKHADGTTSRSFAPVNSIVLDAWQHVAVSFDGDSTIKMYINGVEQTVDQQSPVANGIYDNSSDELFIGNSSDKRYTFDGIIDEVRIWNTARTTEEIQQNWNRYLKGDEAGLAGYWKMEEGDGEAIADETANENNGTLTSTFWRVGVHLNQPTDIPQQGERNLPKSSHIYQNYPNPFNPGTVIKFEISQPSFVEAIIFDLTGRVVKTLCAENFLQAGNHEIEWNGTNDSGQPVSSGMYLSKIKAGKTNQLLKMLLIK